MPQCSTNLKAKHVYMSLTDSITYFDLVDICESGARILVVASAAGFRVLTLLSAATGVSA